MPVSMDGIRIKVRKGSPLDEPQQHRLISFQNRLSSMEKDPHASSLPPLDLCPLCQVDSLYREKNFHPGWGLAWVSITVVLSLALFIFWNGLMALGMLMGLAFIDLFLYHFLPWRACCYRCQTQFIGFPIHPRHRKFDLHRYELFQQGQDGGKE